MQSSSQIVTTNNQHPTFYRPNALPVAQPTVLKYWREYLYMFNGGSSSNTSSRNIPQYLYISIGMFLLLLDSIQPTSFSGGHFIFSWVPGKSPREPWGCWCKVFSADQMPFLSTNQQCQKYWREKCVCHVIAYSWVFVQQA